MKNTLLTTLFALSSVAATAAEPVKTKINLLEVIKSGAVEYNVNPKSDVHDDPKDIWKFQPDGNLHISGRGYGYVATKDDFRDYHLVLEFKWGTKAWGGRELKALDNGILLHGYGPHGAYAGNWMASIECQIIEGGVGDILVLSPKLADGTVLTTSLSAEIALDRDKEKIWKKGEPRQTVTTGRVNWGKRDVDWVDKKGFRGREDVESPAGEWNRLEVIAKGDTLQYFVNGALVNEAFDCKPSAGKVLLQTEAAEMIVRRYELHPLGEFKETWGAADPVPANGADTLKSKTTYAEAYGTTKNAVTVDAAKELPHYPAVEPKDAIATWQVKKGFALQLAVNEPQVRDPIAICFDERGRMFVCEMIDYSEMRDATPHLGRISMLEDTDGDGHYETSTVFAEDLPWPTGIIWANGCLYVGATPDIWRFEDKDGNGKAEVREKVFTGFGTGLKILNVQGLLNSFQWGPDNRVHVLAGGGNRGVVTCPKRPELPGLELGGKDFWFDPLTHEFGLENGGAQYGMSFDNYGRKFGCSNADHLQYWVYEGDPKSRNAINDMPSARRSIAVDGGAAEVFRLSPDEPWRIIRTRWRISGAVPGAVEGGGRVSGYFTGATGTTIYRGDAYGADFVNNSFSGDAGGQLMHRKIIRPAADGVNLEGERPADERGFEFAASQDTWVRVVNFANAPDGCLHVMDMYREIIEHPWAIPDEIKRNLDLNHGHERGRIYRIVPEGGAGRIGKKVALHEAGTAELVTLLSHPNGWHRDTAQRLLYERQDKAALPLLEQVIAGHDPLAKLHALSALTGQHALSEAVLITVLGDADEHVRERGLILAAGQPGAGSQLMEKIATLAADASPRVRFQLALTLGAFLEKAESPSLDRALVSLAIQDHAHFWIAPAILSAPPAVLTRALFPAMTQDAVLLKQAVPFIAQLIEIRAATQPAADHAALISFITQSAPNPLWLRALGSGLRRAGTTIAKADTGKKLTSVFSNAAAAMGDASTPAAARLAAVELLSFAPLTDSQAALTACLKAGQPDALQNSALTTLAQHSSGQVTHLMLEHWPHYEVKARETALQLLLARQDRQTALLTAIQSGTIPATALSAAQVQSLAQHKDAGIAARAKVVLAAVIPPSRAEVVAKFRDAVTTKGDATRGQTQFMQRCFACHRAAGQGLQVGPDLVTVKAKGRDALLTAILEPGKEIAAQYILYTVTTKDGGTYAGFITEDNAASMTLTMPGGIIQKIERSNIKGSTSSGQSLMPEGLETGMTVQDMADLITFIEELK